jgi:hypothetical protein
MGTLRCVDGSVLSVEAVSCRDRAGRPYEITLNLARNSEPFASVGQRCGYELSQLAQRAAAARLDPEQAAAWPNPDDRFPGLSGLPHDHEYFVLRSRDRADLPGSGELRCLLRSSAVWVGECAGTGHHLPPAGREFAGYQQTGHQRAWAGRRPAGGHGKWRLTRRAVIEAWGAGGVGVRAVLTSAELVAFLDTVLREPDSAVAPGAGLAESAAGFVPTAGVLPVS